LNKRNELNWIKPSIPVLGHSVRRLLQVQMCSADSVSPWLLPVPLFQLTISIWLACSTSQSFSWSYSMLCSSPYWSNTQIHSRNKRHVGGPAMVSLPTACTVQSRILGVALPVRPPSYLTYLIDLCPPMSDIRSGRSLHSVWRGCSQSRLPIPLLWKPRFLCSGPDGMEWPLTWVVPPTCRTLSGTFYNQL